MCNKLFYNLDSKYSRFCNQPPIGMRIRQFLAISTTCYIAATYILCTIPTTFKILQKATKAASFCHKTGVFAPRKWVSCQQQLHELSPKSGASARKKPHARIRNHPIPPPPRPTSGFLKVKICSRNRRFSARVCNAVARARRSPHATTSTGQHTSKRKEAPQQTISDA